MLRIITHFNILTFPNFFTSSNNTSLDISAVKWKLEVIFGAVREVYVLLHSNTEIRLVKFYVASSLRCYVVNDESGRVC